MKKILLVGFCALVLSATILPDFFKEILYQACIEKKNDSKLCSLFANAGSHRLKCDEEADEVEKQCNEKYKDNINRMSICDVEKHNAKYKCLNGK